MTSPRHLLWSLADLEPIPSRLVRAIAPQSILEIGVGDFSRDLLTLAMVLGATLTSIDVKPSFTHNGTIIGKSLDVLAVPQPSFDLAIIDGDHNYYTVTRELENVYRLNPRATCILHDVGWPCGRRDMYYDPKSIPVEHRHDHSWELGVVPGESSLKPWGFRGAGQFAIACHEGGPKNGVMTAVDDFVTERTNGNPNGGAWRLWSIPSVFGLAVLRPPRALEGRTFPDAVDDYLVQVASHRDLLKRLEGNRVELYTEILKRDYR